MQKTIEERIRELNTRFAHATVDNSVVVVEFDANEHIDKLWSVKQFKELMVKERVEMPKPKKAPKQPSDMMLDYLNFLRESNAPEETLRQFENAYIEAKEREKAAAHDRSKLGRLADIWLAHPEGRQYDRLVFSAPGSKVKLGQRDYNLWRGFAVEPKAGDWSLHRNHIFEVICDSRQAEFDWVLNWLAAMIQEPGAHAYAAIVLMGIQGAGKGWFVDKMLAPLFYPPQYQKVGAQQLTAEFNQHLSGRVLIYADEAAWGGDKQAMQKLKSLVTDDTVAIRRMYLPLVTEPSSMHIIIATNDNWPVDVEQSDRRYLVLRVNGKYANRPTYFNALEKELMNGALEAMLHDLQQLKVDRDLLKQPLDNEEKRALKSRSLSREEQWLQNWLMDVVLGDGRIMKEEVYSSYVAYARTSSRYAPMTKVTFGRFLSGIFAQGDLAEYPRDTKVNHQNAYVFPPLETFRAAFDKATGTCAAWPEVDHAPIKADLPLKLVVGNSA